MISGFLGAILVSGIFFPSQPIASPEPSDTQPTSPSPPSMRVAVNVDYLDSGVASELVKGLFPSIVTKKDVPAFVKAVSVAEIDYPGNQVRFEALPELVLGHWLRDNLFDTFPLVDVVDIIAPKPPNPTVWHLAQKTYVVTELVDGSNRAANVFDPISDSYMSVRNRTSAKVGIDKLNDEIWAIGSVHNSLRYPSGLGAVKKSHKPKHAANGSGEKRPLGKSGGIIRGVRGLPLGTKVAVTILLAFLATPVFCRGLGQVIESGRGIIYRGGYLVFGALLFALIALFWQIAVIGAS